MINMARRSMFFGIFVLIMTMFVFDTTTKAAFVIANDSHDRQLNIQAILEQESPFFQDLFTPGIDLVSLDVTVKLKNDKKPAADAAKAFKATAYCLRGRTASGSGVRRGIVAADPRVLPLGSKIQLTAGSYSGSYTVTDTGGAIKGRIIDVWVPSCSEAKRFGRKKVMVSVLSKSKRKR